MSPLGPSEGRHRGTKHYPPDRHSGSAPRDLGERIRRPNARAALLLPLGSTLTRAEYYLLRYGEAPP